MEIYDVVIKLIGPVNPIRETRVDDERFANLKAMTELVDKLLTDIDSVITLYFENGTKNEDMIGDQFINLLSFKDSVFKSSYDAKTALCKQKGGQWSDKLYQCLECQ